MLMKKMMMLSKAIAKNMSSAMIIYLATQWAQKYDVENDHGDDVVGDDNNNVVADDDDDVVANEDVSDCDPFYLFYLKYTIF